MRTPHETTEAIQREFAAALHNVFPMETGQRRLVLDRVHFADAPAHDDYNAQKDVVLKNGTWGAAVRGDFSLVDKDGAVIERAKNVSLGKLPTPTSRHTFIVGGREYSVSNQRRSKPGIYTKIGKDSDPSDAIKAEFNLAKGKNFSVMMTAHDGLYYLNHRTSSGGDSKVLAYPVLKHVFGMNDAEIEKYIPKAQLDANQKIGEAKAEDELRKLWVARKSARETTPPATMNEITSSLREYFNGTMMDSGLNKMTVGHEFDKVSGEAIARGMQLVHQMHQGEVDPTNRDHISFTKIHGVEDHLRERIEQSARNISYRVRPKLAKRGITELGLSSVIGGHVNSFFTTDSRSRSGNQVNILEMAENVHKLTPLGQGGISESRAVPDSTRNVNPSYAGFIDPVRTPDNDKAGVDMRLSVNVKKEGNSLSTLLINPKTGAKERVKADDLFDKYVGFDKEPPDHNGLVRSVYRGSYVSIPKSRLDYLVPSDDQFTVSTTLVPFVQSSHAHRSAMGAKMLNQALSLVHREAPIVDTIHSEKVPGDTLPKAPVDGVIKKIEEGVIHIKGNDGKTHKVNYAHDFPLNGNSYLHTDLHVKEGDSVKTGQVLGDNTFTRGGKLALGTNLHVAYVPFKGYNFEDGIVATESGAKKLVSQHMFTHAQEQDERWAKAKKGQSVVDQYRIFFPGKLSSKHVDHLDEDGVVRVGTELHEGDYVVCSMRRYEVSPHQALMGTFSKNLKDPYRDTSEIWDKPYPGVVTNVAKNGNTIKVTVKAHAPLEVGDKLAGRHGNKGVVVAIVPDHEAPQTKDGKVPDLLLNPAGLITRMNNAQIFETAASKALEASGVNSFQFKHFLDPKHGNTYEQVKKIVDASGVRPEEVMFDGKTGKQLKDPVFNGKQYFLKLEKQAVTGFSARSFGDYDIDNRPSKGGEDAAKAIGSLDFYAFLAHDARNILRESATHKAEGNREVMFRMLAGHPLPPPKATYAYEKFLTMVKGMGLNVQKEGSKLRLLPMTDKDVLAISAGEIKEPLMAVGDKHDPLTGMPFAPEKGGLYDPHVTGGLRGQKWSHIALAEPMVSPTFAHAVKKVLEMNDKTFKEYMIGGRADTTADGRTLYGGEAIAHRLSQIDPAKRIAELNEQLKATSSDEKRKKLYTQIRYLTPLAKTGMKAHEAYVVNHVPVIPPMFRPIYPDAKTGNLTASDATVVYKNLLLLNNQMKEAHSDDVEGRNKLRAAVHDAFTKVYGMDGASEGEREGKGFMKIVGGDGSAKDGFFQSKLVSRVQDIAGRGVAVPDPTLGIDHVGLPEPMAWKLYRPMVSSKLVQSGYSIPDAADHIKRRSELARGVLDTVMKDHPVIISRAPSLHKFNVMAFNPIIVPGKSLRTNTLINKGFNLDHDGDALNVHIPISHDAIQDARKMLPSRNLFSPLNGAPVHEPSQEVIMGLWKATAPQGKAVRKFATKEEAMAAYNRGEISINDAIEVGDH